MLLPAVGVVVLSVPEVVLTPLPGEAAAGAAGNDFGWREVLPEGGEPIGHEAFDCLPMKVLKSFWFWPTPCPTSRKYPRMSSAYQNGGLSYRNRIGTMLVESCRYTTCGGNELT